MAPGDKKKATKPVSFAASDLHPDTVISSFQFSFKPFGQSASTQDLSPTPLTLFTPKKAALFPVKTPMMALSYQDEKKKYMSLRGEVEDNQYSGRAEEIRNSPLFSLMVKHSVDYGTTEFGECDSDEDLASGTQDVDLAKKEPEVNVAASNGKPATTKAVKGTKSILATAAKAQQDALLPSYNLIGYSATDQHGLSEGEPILLNTAAPTSTFVCGSQGSGKSYTLTSMLENCLIPNSDRGLGGTPMAGVVFHYDSDGSKSLAEAASLAKSGVKVRVLCSASALAQRKDAYFETYPKNLEVWPLFFADKYLNTERLLSLVSVNDSDGQPPLSINVVTKVLRDIKNANQRGDFDVDVLNARLKEQEFDAKQSNMLEMRMSLLDAFRNKVASRAMGDKKDPFGKFLKKEKGTCPGPLFIRAAGVVTIVDLTDPALKPSFACVLFLICLGLLSETFDGQQETKLVIALDEAHKWLSQGSSAADDFVKHLTTNIRQQRHNAMRVIVATQEPTISHDLLDLCSTSIVHRFTSPAWFQSIQEHLGAASKLTMGGRDRDDLFSQIMRLRVGESLVFSPSSYMILDCGEAEKMGMRVLKMKTRKRDGYDAGGTVYE